MKMLWNLVQHSESLLPWDNYCSIRFWDSFIPSAATFSIDNQENKFDVYARLIWDAL